MLGTDTFSIPLVNSGFSDAFVTSIVIGYWECDYIPGHSGVCLQVRRDNE